MKNLDQYHYSRAWTGPGLAELDPECTCEKAPCGMVLSAGWGVSKGENCPNHDFTRTIRSSHREEDCPALSV